MLQWFETAPRRILALICAACVAMLAFGLYLQHVVGLEPCPMCIVQRYAIMALAVLATLAWATRKGSRPLTYASLLFAGFGAFPAGFYRAELRTALNQYFPAA